MRPVSNLKQEKESKGRYGWKLELITLHIQSRMSDASHRGLCSVAVRREYMTPATLLLRKNL